MINAAINHKAFGKGIVTAQDDKYIKVSFSNSVGTKTFLYPDAFHGYIKYEDEALQKQMDEKLSAIIRLQEEEKARAEEAAAEKLRILTILHKAAKKPAKKSAAQRKKPAVQGGETVETDSKRMS